MKLAILGTRGVPPRYGGFETFAAELGTRLVQRGHEVTVYCRRTRGFGIRDSGFAGPSADTDSRSPHSRPRPSDGDSGESRIPNPESLIWNGIRRIVLPAIGHKYLETVSHTFLSALDALRRDYDAVLLCNAANAFVIPLLRAARIPLAINVDGVERKRRKWNALGRAVYLTGEALSASFADRVVADAEVIADYYRQNFGIETTTIPYGAEFPDEQDSDVLQRLGLEPGNYILYVSRFEPENNPLEVVKAYEKLLRPATCDLPPLVMLGQGLYARDLVRDLHAHESPQIRFPGALYGADYRTLQRNALIYVQATEVGGTHPALIEAMASGGAVVAYGTPENREAGGDSIGYFDLHPAETLSAVLQDWLMQPAKREFFRARARERAAGRYSWAAVTDAYEALFREIAK